MRHRSLEARLEDLEERVSLITDYESDGFEEAIMAAPEIVWPGGLRQKANIENGEIVLRTIEGSTHGQALDNAN